MRDAIERRSEALPSAPCPAGLALCGVPCGCRGSNPSHRAAGEAAAAAEEQSRRERAALDQAFRALAYQYGGTRPEQHTEPEDVAGCQAMHVAARALGKVSSCPELPQWEADLTAIDFDPVVYAAKHLAV